MGCANLFGDMSEFEEVDDGDDYNDSDPGPFDDLIDDDDDFFIDDDEEGEYWDFEDDYEEDDDESPNRRSTMP